MIMQCKEWVWSCVRKIPRREIMQASRLAWTFMDYIVMGSQKSDHMGNLILSRPG